jgi:hypothetical protein
MTYDLIPFYYERSAAPRSLKSVKMRTTTLKVVGRTRIAM